MSALLKAGDRHAQSLVSRFVADQQSARQAVTSDSDAIADKSSGKDLAPAPVEPSGAMMEAADFERNERDELRRQLEATRAQLADLQSEADKTREAAYARGITEGKAQAQSLEQERVDLLADAIQQSHKTLEAYLVRLEPMAFGIARAGLEKIIGKDSDRAALLPALVRHHLGQLAADMVVQLRVSRTDFPTDDVLAPLAATTGGLAVVADPQLQPGQCLFDLTLGRYDASIDLQWAHLQQLFDDLARREPGA